KDTPLLETFKMTDEVLLQAVKGIAELVSVPGLINLDFADIKTVMKDKGMALMGRGMAEGADRAEKAISFAVSSPLLEGVSIKGATGMIVNITSDSSLSLSEVQSASAVLTQLADPSADIIVGAVIDENMAGRLSVTVIATGFMGNVELQDSSNLNVKADISDKVAFQDSGSIKADIPDKAVFQASSSIKAEKEFMPKEKTIHQDVDSLNTKQEEESKTEELVKSDGMAESSPKKSSPREMLLSKAREYEENQKIRDEKTQLDNQMSMSWEDSSMEEKLSSPFESSIDFSDEDMV
ncbi:MAG: hypothetical protein OXJ52_04985, partial [Oligoflexia bacterium]|nr:hypothetical protein [Oligoflexia bacterium]